MYKINCPYCQKDTFTCEVEGCHGYYVPHECEHCNKTYYILQRSWFDLTYDTSNVDVKTQEDMDRMVKEGILKQGKK